MDAEPPSMLSRDTSPEAEAVQIALLRQAPVWKRLRAAAEMSIAVKQLARVGIESRHPGASEREIRRLLADVLLGPELAAKAYGE
jgi:hypothetical protein